MQFFLYRGITECYDIQLIDLHVSRTVLFILYKVRLHVSTIRVVIVRSLISFKSQRAVHTYGIPVVFTQKPFISVRDKTQYIHLVKITFICVCVCMYRSHGTLATKITTHVLMFTTTRPIRRTPIIVVLTLTHMYGGRYNICKNWFYPLH